MQTQISRNNRMTVLLLMMFPLIILGVVWAFIALLNYFGNGYYDQYGNVVNHLDAATVNYYFLQAVPWVVGGVGVWFVVAYLFNSSMVRAATGAHEVTRRENPRLYNIVENLCMTAGMDMPKVNIVNDPQLNAFASGIDKKSYTVTVTTGLMNLLDDDELSGVIGHELTHIRNHDTRLLITSIIFVGIISTVMSMVSQTIYNIALFGGGGRRVGSRDNDGNKNSGLSIIVVLIIGYLLCAVAYLFTSLTRFAISRKREYMADAGGAELCGNPLALASALRKISGDPGLQNVKRDDIAQLFIVHPQNLTAGGAMSFLSSLFSTHPDTKKRIEILEQF